jgi:hypothetical protein
MKNSIAMILLAMALDSCAQTKNLDDLKKKYIHDDLSIYVENPLPTDNDPDRYTDDNKVYSVHRKFIFDYFIVKGGDTLQISTAKSDRPVTDFQREWNFISKNTIHSDKIETISISVEPGVTNVNQTMVKYEYQYVPEFRYNTFSSTSGVIENEMNTWMHPHRDKYFMILELNPFPFIQQPFEIGNKWTWSLRIGDYWKDDRWKLWTGSITNSYEYEIVGKEKLKTKMGEMECWVVQGTATSPIGSTGLTAYYNEQNGFVKLDYINIDKSKLTIEIKEIR